MFSNNGAPGMQAQRDERVERSALVTVLVIAASMRWGARAGAGGCAGRRGRRARLALVAVAALEGARQPAGLGAACRLRLAAGAPVLRAGAALGWWGSGPATHALTVGLIGLITLGMITRTARSATLAAAARRPVRAAGLRGDAQRGAGARLPAACGRRRWSAPRCCRPRCGRWLLRLPWRYAPMLMRPRADGQPMT
jgi:uncharacterized protein involved in response to NO